jgi:hypothetical protein
MLAACSSKDTSASANGDVADSASAVPKLTDVNVQSYDLDMDKVQKWLGGMAALMSAAKTDSSVAAAVASNGNETTQQTIAKLEGNATARDLLNKAGLSPRDYVMTMTAYLQAALADAAQTANPPGKAPADVNQKNVDFIRQHRAELEPLIKKAGLAA